VIDKHLRRPKEQVLNAPAAVLPRSLHPTGVTLLALAVGILAAVVIAFGAYWWGLALWIINRMLDGLDGTLARRANLQSDLGGYLDIVLDHIVYAAIPLALVLSAPSYLAALGLAILFASFYINGASWMYLAALLEKRNRGASSRQEMTTVTMPSGLVEGAETIVLFSLFLIFPGQLPILFGIMAVLVMVTAGQRVVWAVRNLR
jgi:phosphatidylglycerophosphate synthase